MNVNKNRKKCPLPKKTGGLKTAGAKARSPDGTWRSGGGRKPEATNRLSRAGARADIFGRVVVVLGGRL